MSDAQPPLDGSCSIMFQGRKGLGSVLGPLLGCSAALTGAHGPPAQAAMGSAAAPCGGNIKCILLKVALSCVGDRPSA